MYQAEAFHSPMEMVSVARKDLTKSASTQVQALEKKWAGLSAEDDNAPRWKLLKAEAKSEARKSQRRTIDEAKFNGGKEAKKLTYYKHDSTGS